MKEKKFRLRPRYLIVAALLLLLLLSGAVGKYVQTISKSGTVTFTASLAESVVLQESVVERNADGTYGYKIVDGNHTYTTTGQEYALIPGVDIPKDPHIVITGKTEIPAYLYIEIVDAGDTVTIDGESVDLTSYSVIAEDWNESTDISPEHGGTVYKYKNKIDDQFTAYPIYILQEDGAGNTITVSQHVKCSETKVTNAITIYAYLVEAASVGTP